MLVLLLCMARDSRYYNCNTIIGSEVLTAPLQPIQTMLIRTMTTVSQATVKRKYTHLHPYYDNKQRDSTHGYTSAQQHGWAHVSVVDWFFGRRAGTAILPSQCFRLLHYFIYFFFKFQILCYVFISLFACGLMIWASEVFAEVKNSWPFSFLQNSDVTTTFHPFLFHHVSTLLTWLFNKRFY